MYVRERNKNDVMHGIHHGKCHVRWIDNLEVLRSLGSEWGDVHSSNSKRDAHHLSERSVEGGVLRVLSVFGGRANAEGIGRLPVK